MLGIAVQEGQEKKEATMMMHSTLSRKIVLLFLSLPLLTAAVAFALTAAASIVPRVLFVLWQKGNAATGRVSHRANITAAHSTDLSTNSWPNWTHNLRS